jgi:hypothetical protein
LGSERNGTTRRSAQALRDSESVQMLLLLQKRHEDASCPLSAARKDWIAPLSAADLLYISPRTTEISVYSRSHTTLPSPFTSHTTTTTPSNESSRLVYTTARQPTPTHNTLNPKLAIRPAPIPLTHRAHTSFTAYFMSIRLRAESPPRVFKPLRSVE